MSKEFPIATMKRVLTEAPTNAKAIAVEEWVGIFSGDIGRVFVRATVNSFKGGLVGMQVTAVLGACLASSKSNESIFGKGKEDTEG